MEELAGKKDLALLSARNYSCHESGEIANRMPLMPVPCAAGRHLPVVEKLGVA
jgi:hypothetical protein